MNELANEKPAGGNLRVDGVASSMGAGCNNDEGTPDSAESNTRAFADTSASEVVAGDEPLRVERGWDTWDAWDPAIAADRVCPNPIPQSQSHRDYRDGRFAAFRDMEGYQDGVHWIGTERDRQSGESFERDPEWVCSPLTIAATTHDGAGQDWGRLLVFTDRAGHEHRWAMPMEILGGTGESLRAELLRLGLEITSDFRLRARLVQYILRANPGVTARCVSRTGWDGEVFVLPHRTYGDTEEAPVIFQTKAPDGIALSQRGTLDDWRTRVAAPCTGNSRLVFALSCAFAGPCLGLIGAEGGGVHFRGGSSVGKSTALCLAASVFGPPRFARTWRQTDNAIEGIAALHSDLLLILDEIGQLDPRAAGATAYMLANGQGKGRARRDGAPRAPSAFRVLFLSSGEIGLHELMAEDGKRVRAGQEVRVIDVPADAGCGLGLFDRVPEGIVASAFADQLKAGAAEHYGHALPAFLAGLLMDVDGARTRLMLARKEIAESLVGKITDGQVCRVAQRFALIAIAGELATAYGVTGWAPGEAEHAARACFRGWIGARGSKGNAEPAAMLAQVRGFLEAHGDARFTSWDDPHPPRTHQRAGFRKFTNDGPVYYIEREVFRTEVTRSFGLREVEGLLLELGVLQGDGSSPTRMERLPDNRKARVYKITPAIWGIEV